MKSSGSGKNYGKPGIFQQKNYFKNKRHPTRFKTILAGQTVKNQPQKQTTKNKTPLLTSNNENSKKTLNSFTQKNCLPASQTQKNQALILQKKPSEAHHNNFTQPKEEPKPQHYRLNHHYQDQHLNHRFPQKRKYYSSRC